MTAREAIDFIDNEVQIDVRFCSVEKIGKTIKVFNYVKSILEKQIPEKIDKKDGDDLVVGCHCCGEVNALWKSNGDRNTFCGNCGQAIRW